MTLRPFAPTFRPHAPHPGARTRAAHRLVFALLVLATASPGTAPASSSTTGVEPLAATRVNGAASPAGADPVLTEPCTGATCVTVMGRVHDLEDRPLAGAVVTLLPGA
ncbi:MAG: hypothetical protein MI919_26535, partial [Holophagales bacterium]|nr:hypothetical protein [Holophagales bacterium]